TTVKPPVSVAAAVAFVTVTSRGPNAAVEAMVTASTRLWGEELPGMTTALTPVPLNVTVPLARTLPRRVTVVVVFTGAAGGDRLLIVGGALLYTENRCAAVVPPPGPGFVTVMA